MLTRILRSFAFLAAWAIVAVVLPPAPAMAQSDHTIPYGTPVYVRLAQPLSSYHAVSGMELPVRVVRDVVIDGCVVIARGAHGIAEAVDAVEAAPGDHTGELLLELRWVRAVDHTRIGITGELERSGRPATAAGVGEDIAYTGLGITALGAYEVGAVTATAGLAVQNLAYVGRGGEAKIGRGEIIKGYIANSWGVIVPSDIPAEGEDDTPIR